MLFFVSSVLSVFLTLVMAGGPLVPRNVPSHAYDVVHGTATSISGYFRPICQGSQLVDADITPGVIVPASFVKGIANNGCGLQVQVVQLMPSSPDVPNVGASPMVTAPIVHVCDTGETCGGIKDRIYLTLNSFKSMNSKLNDKQVVDVSFGYSLKGSGGHGSQGH